MTEVSEMTQEQQTVMHPCAHCGGPKPPGRGRMYCSKRCKDNAWEDRQRQLETRRHEIPENEVTPGRENEVTPGRENEVTPGRENEVTRCRACGIILPARAKQSRSYYCSAACKQRASRERWAAAAAAAEEAEWIPEWGDNSPAAAARRRDLIRELAFRGNSSDQIGERINMLAETVRRIARELSIAIPADEVVRKRRRHNPDRIIRETAQALEGLVMGVGLVDLQDADPDEAKQWVTSLTSSIRDLNRFTKQIKEMTQ